ncbi:hypothetical protein [Fulvivirga sedimenti]|jgi:hypothetical protein|uniref:Uncharacterized protein n=1 Tax=Fulvivirga sedimenti TaxID=2879465 RepID=A0A9X1HXL1_9BACT|nr:hypothetical protein [Fulvivirga sedimenti]MCA6079195.1 hypothetical protein [Fulvivirga sedimenti]
MKKLTLTGALGFYPMLSMAHSGHGSWSGTALHYLTSFWHILPLLLSLMLVVFIVRKIRTANKKA